MSDDYGSLTLLIQEMLDGVLDDDQRADLLKRVESDDAARKLYLDQIAAHTALQSVLAECHPHRVGEATASHTETDSIVATKSRWFAAAAITSMAATIVMLLCGIAYLLSQNSPIATSVDSPHIAVVTQSVGAYDGDNAIRPRAEGHFRPASARPRTGSIGFCQRREPRS